MRRAGAREDIDLLNALRELGIRHSVQILSREDDIGVCKAERAGHGARGAGMVAGDHLHLYSGAAATRHSRNRFLARRVGKTE